MKERARPFEVAVRWRWLRLGWCGEGVGSGCLIKSGVTYRAKATGGAGVVSGDELTRTGVAAGVGADTCIEDDATGVAAAGTCTDVAAAGSTGA